jgi:hypothetical protein
MARVRWQLPEPAERAQGFHDSGALQIELSKNNIPEAIQAISNYMDDYLDIQNTIQFLQTLEEPIAILGKLTTLKLLYLLEAIQEDNIGPPVPLKIEIEEVIRHKYRCQLQNNQSLFVAYLLEYQGDPRVGACYRSLLESMLAS